MGLLYGRAGRLTAQNGGFGPRWAVAERVTLASNCAEAYLRLGDHTSALYWSTAALFLDRRHAKSSARRSRATHGLLRAAAAPWYDPRLAMSTTGHLVPAPLFEGELDDRADHLRAYMHEVYPAAWPRGEAAPPAAVAAAAKVRVSGLPKWLDRNIYSCSWRYHPLDTVCCDCY